MALSRALSRSPSPGASISFCTCSRSRHLGSRFSCLGVRIVASGLAVQTPRRMQNL